MVKARPDSAGLGPFGLNLISGAAERLTPRPELSQPAVRSHAREWSSRWWVSTNLTAREDSSAGRAGVGGRERPLPAPGRDIPRAV